MSSETKIYSLKDIIRHNESGKLDKEKSLEIIRKLVATAYHHKNHNILVDLRETELKGQDLHTLMDLTLELAPFRNVFINKIANVVPNDSDRLKTAKLFKACLDTRGFNYEVFTDFEEAMEWLADSVLLHKER